MIVVGAWVLIVGYGIMYSGIFKLTHPGQSVSCSLGTAFMGQCTSGSTGNRQTSAAAPAPQQLPSQIPNGSGVLV